VIATVALFLVLAGGTALAAHKLHYLISSLSQIKPSVREKLQGAAGQPGATGAAGAPGAQGATGGNGAVASYFASNASIGLGIGTNTGDYTTVASKTLPAGNWIVSGDTAISGYTSEAPTTYDIIGVECELTAAGTEEAAESVQFALGETSGVGDAWVGEADDSTQSPISLSAPATIALKCAVGLPAQGQQSDFTGLGVEALGSTLSAVQVSSTN
jgi:hypothetical protein